MSRTEGQKDWTAGLGIVGAALAVAGLILMVTVVLRSAAQFEPNTVESIELWRYLARAAIAAFVAGVIAVVVALRQDANDD